ncbi:MAG: hypothetical protein U1E78_03975 [Gammaproteobacteria bacterium]
MPDQHEIELSKIMKKLNNKKKGALGWFSELFSFASTTGIGGGIGGLFGKGVGLYLAPKIAEKVYHGVHNNVIASTQEIAENAKQETFIGSIVESFLGYAPSSNLVVQAPRIANQAGLSAYSLVSEMIEKNCTLVGVVGTSAVVGGMYLAYRLGQSANDSKESEHSNINERSQAIRVN